MLKHSHTFLLHVRELFQWMVGLCVAVTEINHAGVAQSV